MPWGTVPSGLPYRAQRGAAALSHGLLRWRWVPERAAYTARTRLCSSSHRQEWHFSTLAAHSFASAVSFTNRKPSQPSIAPSPQLESSTHLQEGEHSAPQTPLKGRSHKTRRSTTWIPEDLSGGAPQPDRSDAEASGASQQAESSLPTLSHPYRTIAFYHLVDIPAPEQVVQQHRRRLGTLDVRGRIYISSQGINAQLSGPTDHALAYAQWVSEQPLFQGLRWNEDGVSAHMFPRLRLAVKPNLVQLAGGMSSLPITSPQARAREVPPAEWQHMLRNAQQISPAPSPQQDSKPVLLDVRNGYEWDAGHFQGATRPLEDNFVDTPVSNGEEARPQIPAVLRGKDPATPVMMYCTGGIRCDIYSAHLRRMGFHNLMTLQGGIQNYLKQAGSDHWKGSLFVFDGRMAVPASGQRGQLTAAAPCALCGGQAKLPHSNCANVDCNRLFISCPSCRERVGGCCCTECLQAASRRRPAISPGEYNYYGKLSSLPAMVRTTGAEGAGEEGGALHRRGAGRQLKRQRRAERLHEQHEAVLAERAARKAMARAAMEEQGSQQLTIAA